MIADRSDRYAAASPMHMRTSAPTVKNAVFLAPRLAGTALLDRHAEAEADDTGTRAIVLAGAIARRPIPESNLNELVKAPASP